MNKVFITYEFSVRKKFKNLEQLFKIGSRNISSTAKTMETVNSTANGIINSCRAITGCNVNGRTHYKTSRPKNTANKSAQVFQT